MRSNSNLKDEPCVASLALRVVRRLIVVVCLLGAVRCAASLTTNIVDLAALAACGSGTTNGWEIADLGTYDSASAAYKPNIRFSTKESYAKSPDFGGNIRRVEFDYRSSSDNGKRLFVTNEEGAPLHTCGYTSKGAFTNCIIEVSAPNERRIIFKYDDGTGAATWSLANLKIITESDLAAVPNGAAMRLKWYNSSDVVSNRVDIFRVKQTSCGETNEVYRYDFSKLNTISATGDISDSVYRIFGESLYGELLYVEKESPEVLKLSTGKSRGTLFIKCPIETPYSHIRLVLKRYVENDEGETSLSWGLLAETNVIAAITLTDSFTTNYVSLAAVPDYASLCLNATGNKNAHRVLVSDIAFVTIKEPEYENINVCSKTVKNVAFLDVKGLMPRRPHYFTVTTFTSDGSSTVSEPSDWFYPVLPPGLLFFVK